MWASRPYLHADNDMPMDLRKKDVLRRDQDENLLDLSRKRWQPPSSPPDESGRGRGTLENAIWKLHQSKKAPEPPKEERCRSTDTILGNKDSSSSSLEDKRSSSCPDLTVLLPTPPPPLPRKPSPIKPKSSFIQRSTGLITSTTSDHHFNNPTPIIGGAKKRKSFVPVYGDNHHHPSPVKRRPPSPIIEHHRYDEYYSHPEVLLRRQLQQEPPPYLLHVYDYYQQLVQRLRENNSPTVRRMPPPMSPTSLEDEVMMQGDVANRKRPCRALTGKHVRQGTGASISTLLTLRQKIQERQKAKEQPRFNGLCHSSKNLMKKGKQLKAKENALKAYC